MAKLSDIGDPREKSISLLVDVLVVARHPVDLAEKLVGGHGNGRTPIGIPDHKLCWILPGVNSFVCMYDGFDKQLRCFGNLTGKIRGPVFGVVEKAQKKQLELSHLVHGYSCPAIKRSQCLGDVVAINFVVAFGLIIDRGNISKQLH